MQKVLIIGPFPKPISGVALANSVLKKTLDKSNLFKTQIINTSLPFFEESIGKFSFKKFFFFISLNFKVLKVFNANKIYMTPGQSFFGVAKYSLFILLAFVLKKELIIHVHGNYLGTEYKLLKGFKKKYFYFLLSKFNKGIVLSESLLKNLTPFISKENIYVVYNFAENFLYEKDHAKDFSSLKITFLSNLMEEKGILYLLDTLLELETKNINYSARIAGNIDESLKEKINSKIDKLEHTKYIGVVYDNQKKELLDWSNIFILPTFYKMEGQPISILEALATKNVIITTNHSGISDIITSEVNGFMVRPKNVSDIIEKLVILDNDKTKIKSIAESNKKYFLNNFTLNEFQSKIIKVINESPRIR